MPVFRWGEAWNVFHDLEREVDRLLQSANFTLPEIRWGRQFPAVNLYETESEYILTAELPGLKSEDLELTIANGILSMSGSREDPNDVPEDRFRRRERFRGSWQRSFSIPNRVEEDKLSAAFKNGVLQIHLPKLAEATPRKIEVTDVNL